MKWLNWRITFLLVAVSLLPVAATAQRKPAKNVSVEQSIKKLDLEAAKAVLDRDEKGIARYFATNSVTNNPRNGLTIGSAGVIDAANNGLIDYYKFERAVESVQVLGNTAITMGQETITMRNPMGGAGAVYLRRYTNVWMKTGSTWQIVARHASVICKPN
jgi:ketosteroid isomerase-like protein